MSLDNTSVFANATISFHPFPQNQIEVNIPVGIGDITFKVDAEDAGMTSYSKTPNQDQIAMAFAIALEKYTEYVDREAGRVADKTLSDHGL